MRTTRKKHLCVICGNIFEGCQVFEGYVRKPDYCSIKCYEKESEARLLLYQMLREGVRGIGEESKA